MKKILLISIILIFSVSCAQKIIDVKSPCVSAEGGPCGPKMPINDWWLKDYKTQS